MTELVLVAAVALAVTESGAAINNEANAKKAALLLDLITVLLVDNGGRATARRCGLSSWFIALFGDV